MISHVRPHKIRSLSLLCKRNIVFFLQQFVEANQQGGAGIPCPPGPLVSLSRCFGMFQAGNIESPKRLSSPTRSYAVSVMFPPLCARSSVVTVVTMMLLTSVVAPAAIGQVVLESNVDHAPADFDALVAQQGTQSTFPSTGQHGDRLWLISTRRLTSEACRADLDHPAMSFMRLYCGAPCQKSSVDEYLQTVGRQRSLVVYVHGNRLDSKDAIARSFSIYRQVRARLCGGPVDWVLFSWPSAKQGALIRDFREKAERTDAQGLYLGWLLRKHAEASLPTALIGYSFGARVVTGSLHAMAGGKLGGRRLPGPAVEGANFDAGLVAPAIESNWMTRCGYHGRATKNLDRLVVLFNHRDAVLKRYWLLDRVRGSVALGYSGPRSFGPRADGSRISLRARDCAPFVGLRHDEVDYYTSRCSAGAEMASLIHDIDITH